MAKLVDLLTFDGIINWQEIARRMNNRSMAQLKHHWKRVNKKKLGERWRKEEDSVLSKAVEKDGWNWNVAAFFVYGRDNRQYRERFVLRLSVQNRDLGSWKGKENKRLLKLQKQYGNKWQEISKRFNGRNSTQVAARCRILMKIDAQTSTTRTVDLKGFPDVNTMDIGEFLHLGRLALKNEFESRPENFVKVHHLKRIEEEEESGDKSNEEAVEKVSMPEVLEPTKALSAKNARRQKHAEKHIKTFSSSKSFPCFYMHFVFKLRTI